MISYLKFVKRIIIFIIGSTVVLIGIICIVTPGPAFVIIPTGLAILATEFVWAKRWLERVKDEIRNGAPTIQSWRDHLHHWWRGKRK